MRSMVRDPPARPPDPAIIRAVGGGETARLLGAALQGQDGARADLLERLRPRVVLWAASRMSDGLKEKVDPEDVAQEVLMAVHQGLDGLDADTDGGLMPWLFTIAENRIRDLVKYFGAKKRAPVERVRRTRTSPSAFAARAEQLDRMRAALERLAPPHREIIRLRSIQERPYGEIATLTERSEGACRVLYCRALAALRDALAEIGDGGGA